MNNVGRPFNCRKCGVGLPTLWATDICLKCSEQEVKQIFKEHPDIKKAFVETVKEMKKELQE